MIVLRKSWLGLIFAPRGSVMGNIWGRMAVTCALSVAVTFAYFALGRPHWTLTTLPFSLVGLALSIFLGFRNNTSYDRYWEGRKLWGAEVNAARTFARRCLLYVGPASEGADDAAVRAFQVELIHRVIAYVHALRLHLRDQTGWASLEGLVPHDELAAAVRQHNVPLALLTQIGMRLRVGWRQGWISEYHLVDLEQVLSELMNIQGGCERIKSTPIPFSYTVLIHRIVAFYCIALPFGIVATVGQLTPLVVLMISYAFFGLDAIGDEIEQPFGTDPNDLPLSTISRMIEVNLREQLGEQELPSLLQADAAGQLE